MRYDNILVAVDNRIPFHQIDSPEDLEAVCILTSPTAVCVIYIPPSSPDAHYGNLFTFLSSLRSTSEDLLILGDFNLPDIDWDILTGHSLVSNQFCDLVFHTNLCQLISTPTHIRGNILDLLLTNLDDRISNLQIHLDSYLKSDHNNVTFSVAFHIRTSFKAATYFTFNYSRGDYQGLLDYLLHSDFTPCYSSHNVEFIWQTINDILMNAMHLFIPVNKIHLDNCPMWFNSEIRHLRKQLKTLRRKYNRYPTHHISIRINSLENMLQDRIILAKQNFECYLVNSYASINSNKIF